MSKNHINLGMIGAGFIGQQAHIPNFVDLPNCTVLGVAEFKPELRQKVADRYAIKHTYKTHQQLLENQDIDAVVIVTPRPQTAHIVRDALNAGKHVFSEKPMAVSVEQGKELTDLARERGLKYCVGYMKRYDEGVQLAKTMLDEVTSSGELGELLYVRAHCYMGNSYCNAYGHVITNEVPEYPNADLPSAPAWIPESRRKDFADYTNTYSHLTNLLRYLFAEVPLVEYARTNSPMTQLAIFKYQNFLANLETGRSSNRSWDEIIEIYFADGKLTIEPPPALLRNVPAKVKLYKAGNIQQVIEPQCNWSWSFRNQASAYINDIIHEQPSLISGDEALKDLEIIEAVWKKALNL